MKLGTKGQYAVLALVDLAYHGQGKPLSLAEIATRQSLPVPYLEQLFAKLRNHGFVHSTRGAQGGYTLAREAGHIQIAEILEAIGESINTTRCSSLSKKGCQGGSAKCLTHDLWEGLSRHMQNYLEGVSLADVCERRLS